MMKTRNKALTALLACALFGAVSLGMTGTASAQDKEPIALKYPSPTLKGTPEDLPKGDPNIEAVPDKPVKFLAPKGVQNVALHKTVTSSKAPFTGELTQIVDGKKEPTDDDAIEFSKGLQWIQIDLGKSYEISAIAVWHDHRYIQIMKSVILQVSDDAEFKTGVTTIYNNDRENKEGLGAGTDKQYFETFQGKVFDAKGVKARYVRGYTHGSAKGALNCWQEVEVYAAP